MCFSETYPIVWECAVRLLIIRLSVMEVDLSIYVIAALSAFAIGRHISEPRFLSIVSCYSYDMDMTSHLKNKFTFANFS